MRSLRRAHAPDSALGALLAGALALAAALSGCSSAGTGTDEVVYYRAASKLPPLEIPPDLTGPVRDNRYVIPDSGRSAAVLSAYQAGRSQDQVTGGAALLPASEGLRIERAGSERWLVADAPAEKLWPVMRNFWQENGLLVDVEVPEAGIMETDWAENLARLPQSLLGRLAEGITAAPQRDKFRTRLERTADGKTEIHLSHRGLVEVFAPDASGRTIWQPRPAEPELEAEFLRRLMVRLGERSERAKEMLATAAAVPASEGVRLNVAPDGSASLGLADPFDRAWRRLGLALDRAGILVDDRDRQRGLIFVRVPPEPDEKKPDSRWFDWLAFWRTDGADKAKQPVPMRVELREDKAGSQVRVLDKSGAVDKSKTGQKLLARLQEQLK